MHASSGVPQGSVLGPLLFILYLSDLPSVFLTTPSVTFRMFADDIKVFAPFSNVNASVIHASMSTALSSLSAYFRTWQLTLSPTKCLVLHLGKNNTRHQYFLDNHPLSPTDCVKDLGILVDSALSFNEHCMSTYKKGLGLVYRLFRSFACTQPAPFIHAYKTYIIPVLEYASPVWNPHKISLIRSLEKVQHVFTRLLYYRCTHVSRSLMPDYHNRCIFLQLQSLQHRRVVNDIVFSVSMLTGRCNLSCSSFWTFKPTLGRISYFHLSTSKPNTDILRFSFSHRTCSYLTSLFKTGLQMHNLTRPLLSVRSDLLVILAIVS